MAHKHRVARESGPFAMGGSCQCPGCHNANAYYTEECRCGALRHICSGMGAASIAVHAAHGWGWYHPEDMINHDRIADHVDGYDRDNLGESPDY
ncbi:MAG: hypothetical protein J2P48_08365 [Alphaproteobacteria bacterium]|nr:hypothetical protein [Alphaproteobacteria bacterium]